MDGFWISSPRLRLNRGLGNVLHVQKTSQIWRKGRLLNPESLDWEVLINLEDFSGPGIFFSFSLNSWLIADVWVSEVTVITVQGDQHFLPEVDENTDALGLRSWTKDMGISMPQILRIPHPPGRAHDSLLSNEAKQS